MNWFAVLINYRYPFFSQKSSKCAFEIARTFSTLFSEAPLRIALSTASDEERFCAILEQRVANIKSYKNIFKANLPEGYGQAGKGYPGDEEQSKVDYFLLFCLLFTRNLAVLSWLHFLCKLSCIFFGHSIQISWICLERQNFVWFAWR